MKQSDIKLCCKYESLDGICREITDIYTCQETGMRMVRYRTTNWFDVYDSRIVRRAGKIRLKSFAKWAKCKVDE
jgi:hypothetical protein